MSEAGFTSRYILRILLTQYPVLRLLPQVNTHLYLVSYASVWVLQLLPQSNPLLFLNQAMGTGPIA